MGSSGHQRSLKPGPAAVRVPLLPCNDVINQESRRNGRCGNTASRCWNLGLSSSEVSSGEYPWRDGYSECAAEVDAERAGLLALEGELRCPAAEGRLCEHFPTRSSEGRGFGIPQR